jgi:hypothetical protein
MKLKSSTPWLESKVWTESWASFCESNAGRVHRESEENFQFADLRRSWPDLCEPLRKALLEDRFEPRAGRAVWAQLDKLRQLVRFPWVERFVYHHFARCLHQDFETLWSPYLWSFRTGRGQSAALAYVSTQLKQDPKLPRWVIRRDVKSYGESMGRAQLLAEIHRHRPLNALESSLLKRLFEYSIEAEGTPARGLPTGSNLQVVCENIYLMGLDEELARFQGLFWSRFGDDLLIVGRMDGVDRLEVQQRIDERIRGLGLSWKLEKSLDLALSSTGAGILGLRGSQCFDYLGRQVFFDGALYLGADKQRAFLEELDLILARCKHQNATRDELITALRRAWTKPQGLALSTLHSLTHDLSEEALTRLDRLIMERVVSSLSGGQFRRGHFKRFKPRELRRLGLPSLLHLRRKAQLVVS